MDVSESLPCGMNIIFKRYQFYFPSFTLCNYLLCIHVYPKQSSWYCVNYFNRYLDDDQK